MITNSNDGIIKLHLAFIIQSNSTCLVIFIQTTRLTFEMFSVVNDLLLTPIKASGAVEDQETLAAWKRRFLTVFEQGDDIAKLQQCLADLPPCSSRFDASDEHAATNKGNFVLHTLHNSKEKCVLDFLGGRDQGQDTVASLKSLGYFTTSFLRDVRAVRCLVREQCFFGPPDGNSGGGGQGDDDLDEALISLNRYMALADPIYLSTCYLEADPTEEVVDPIKRSFQLRNELLAVAEKEYEFKREYMKLCERCNNFTVEVLEECRKLEPEIRCVLESAGATGSHNDSLDILHLAILNENKQVRGFPSVFIPKQHNLMYQQAWKKGGGGGGYS